MNEVSTIDPKEYGLEEKKSKDIIEAFLPKITEREALAEIYGTIIKQELNLETCVEARELRLKLVKVRTGISDIHKTQKAFFLASGRFVDAWKNKETEPVTQMEAKLNEIEKHFDNIEKEAKEKLQADREAILIPYLEETEIVIIPDLTTMDDDVWEAYLHAKKKHYDERIAAEKKAEADRLEAARKEKERQEKIEKENKRLKKEADAKAKQYEAERKEREAAENKARLEREEAEKKREEKARKDRETQDAILEKERKEREGVEAELQAKKEAEEKAEADKKAEIQAELSKGDDAKINDLVGDLGVLKTKYEFKANKNKSMYRNIGGLIDKVLKYIAEHE